MKFFLVIDDHTEPSCTIVCKRRMSIVVKIEELCQDFDVEQEVLYGYREGEIVPLQLSEVVCFFTKDNKVFASTRNGEYATKLRINQICRDGGRFLCEDQPRLYCQRALHSKVCGYFWRFFKSGIYKWV